MPALTCRRASNTCAAAVGLLHTPAVGAAAAVVTLHTSCSSCTACCSQSASPLLPDCWPSLLLLLLCAGRIGTPGSGDAAGTPAASTATTCRSTACHSEAANGTAAAAAGFDEAEFAAVVSGCCGARSCIRACSLLCCMATYFTSRHRLSLPGGTASAAAAAGPPAATTPRPSGCPAWRAV